MPPKRRNYEARFKLTVVDFAEKSNNSAAGRQFGVSEKLIRDFIWMPWDARSCRYVFILNASGFNLILNILSTILCLVTTGI